MSLNNLPIRPSNIIGEGGGLTKNLKNILSADVNVTAPYKLSVAVSNDPEIPFDIENGVTLTVDEDCILIIDSV